jgi:hypothetical protein
LRELLGQDQVDLEYTHVRVCPCGRRVASGLECDHGQPVLFVHPKQGALLKQMAAGFETLPRKR